MSETLFKKVDYTLSKLIDQIELGTLSLPNLQRPFIWKDVKVRDLFDSMYRGYPVGFFLFWENSFQDEHRNIGIDEKQKTPSLLIIDGQQRLTSLYAVIKGSSVLRKNFKERKIKISFNPLNESFEVLDASIERNSEYIPNISKLWQDSSDLFEIVDEYTERLEKARENSGSTLTSDEKKQIRTAINELINLKNFPFVALELSRNIDEERVAEIFVRINSKGIVLNQSDFILTLMSVFWDEGRSQIEEFCNESRNPSRTTPSPFNHFIEPDPEHIIRIAIGYGFRRARLQYAYALLRGKDLETEEFSDERREEQFAILKSALTDTIDLQNWHDFFKVIQQAGFRGRHMITSRLTLIYTYVLYLIGKCQYKVDNHDLSLVISRWFFMANVTQRYTGQSPETQMERDFADLRIIDSGSQYVDWLKEKIDAEITEDFWSITIPNRLISASANSPFLNAYHAALNILDAKALFSRKKVSDLLDPAIKAKKSAVERHHLFPRNYLKSIGVEDYRDINQIANFAFVEWDDNIKIGDKSPAEYVPKYLERFSNEDIHKMYYWHALPDKWEHIDYFEFLMARRKSIAKVIKNGYEELIGRNNVTKISKTEISIQELIKQGETTNIEFKSTLRVNLHTSSLDSRMEHSVLKTIAAFLNSDGGTLLIGADDSGNIIGIENDNFQNEDKMNLHLINLLRNRLGSENMLYIKPKFESVNGRRVLRIDCDKARSAVYLKDGSNEQFFIRTGAATAELIPSQIQEYVRHRFN